MAYKATQVYLEANQHAAFKEQARRRGISMTEYLRQLVDSELRGSAPVPDLTKLAGTIPGDELTDVGRDKDNMVREAVLSDYKR